MRLENCPLSHRIWKNVTVRCENYAEGCEWTGSISDYISHEKSCPEKESVKQILALKEENEQFKADQEQLKTENDARTARCSALMKENKKLKADKEQLKKENGARYSALMEENNQLKADLGRMNCDGNGDKGDSGQKGIRDSITDWLRGKRSADQQITGRIRGKRSADQPITGNIVHKKGKKPLRRSARLRSASPP